MYRVLVVGQTPPPYHGQAIMIGHMLEGQYTRAKLFHARMNFSRNIGEVGRPSWRKACHLVSLVFRIIYMRFRHGIPIIYYPPAGPDKTPMLRDLFILCATRWLFRKTIFHFHAGGVSGLYTKLPAFQRFLFRKAYFKPDASIVLSELNPRDAETLNSKAVFIVPNGIEDHFEGTPEAKGGTEPQILYVGAIKRTKGLLVLLEALGILRERGVSFRASLVGSFESDDFKSAVEAKVRDCGLTDRVDFPGELTGKEKWQAFAKADIFCYPTFFEAETFGLVVLEAMQFELPVVASSWRGVPSLIDEDSGFVVPPKEPRPMADKLEELCRNPKLAEKMGKKARERYLARYSLNQFHRNIEDVFVKVAEA